MEKNDLKSLVTQMYENLIENIDEQETPNKEQIIEYLKDSINVITNIKDNDLDTIEHAKSAFTNAYKEIANKSLSSYAATNGRFHELSVMHKNTLNECKQHIDLPSITNKFNEIQDHMTNEIKKANEVIQHLSEQVKTLETTSNLDALTKIFNRRALTTYLNSVCANEGIPYELHLLMLDIDDFKAINDEHGHIAGDKILIFIANILRKTLRDGDKVFRFGGEEFVIILNRIDGNHCQKITKRILDLIRGNKLIYKGVSLNVTASIGTTKYIPSDTPESIINRADKALYTAKNNGKNQVCSEM